jgi:dTDP-glucose pyrophosphorylase
VLTDLTDTLLPPDTSIREAIACIDRNQAHVVFVVDPRKRLIGSMTDGDVRRGLLHGVNLDHPVETVMNAEPLSAYVNESPLAIKELLVSKGLRHIPIVDGDRHILGLETLETLLQPKERPNWVFLMAGGLGTRLRPFTQIFPKPLLPVGSKALLETILESFISYGFRKFFISVHYKAEMIKAHFGDGKRWGVTIQYIHEDSPLGTAGALGLLEEIPDKSLILMNGDILTKVNFEHLLEFHNEHNATATMCIREYDVQVPYGTVEFDGFRLKRIVEKPVYNFFVNAGIYVFSPDMIKRLKRGERKDMPDLIDEIQLEGGEVVVYPIHEYWLDIGRLADFERAQSDIGEFFGDKETAL